ncbi:MAG: peptide deformylase [Erysipelotrichaceae bacterium]|nr:peptide deformylase [Erysipelotrichaceae bacterium]
MIINNETIIKDSDPIIRKRSSDVALPLSEEDRKLLLDMHKYVYDSTIEEIAEKENLRPAVGISAIQLGVPKKMTAIILKDSEGNVETEYALVNPKIISSSVEQAYLKNGEGCLSVEDEHEGYIYRSARCKVKGYDLISDKDVLIKAEGYLAIVLQHELDHFKGVLFYDHINKKDPFYEDPDAVCIE